MGTFFAIVFNLFFALGACVYDMIMATMGKSKMDKFRKDWYSK